MADTFTPEQIAQILEEFFKVVGTRQYIGARYVPLFGRKDEESIEWDNTAPYEPLTIVLYQGNSYTSRQFVPVGVEITNQEFWAITGNYNAQVEQYRRETAAAREIADNALDAANNAQNDINTLLPKTDFDAENTVKNAIDAANATANNAQNDIDTLLPKADFDAENTVKKYIDNGIETAANDLTDSIAMASQFYMPKYKQVGKIAIAEGEYIQSIVHAGGYLYAFATPVGTKDYAKAYRVKPDDYSIVDSSIIFRSSDINNGGCYANSACQYGSKILLVADISQNIICLYSPCSGTVEFKSLAGVDSLSGFCVVSNESAVASPRNSLNYLLYRKTKSDILARCGMINNTLPTNYLRADMTQFTTHAFGQVHGLGGNDRRMPAFLDVYHTAGYQLSRVALPFDAADTEVQGVSFYNNKLYFVTSFGDVFESDEIPSDVYADPNGISTHEAPFAPMVISGDTIIMNVEGATPAIPYVFETAVAKFPMSNIVAGLHVRGGFLTNTPSAQNPPYTVDILICNFNTGAFTHVLRYQMETDGSFTLTRIRDIANSQNYNVTDVETFKTAMQAANITVRVLGYGEQLSDTISVYENENMLKMADIL